MDNIRALEKRWYFYKIKKYLIYINTFGLVIMLSLGAYYAFTQLPSKINLLTEKKAEIQAIQASSKVNESVATTKRVMPPKVESMVSDAKEEVSLEPVIPIVDLEYENRHSTYTKVHRTAPISKHQEKLVQAKRSTYLTANELVAVNDELDSTKLKKINLHTTSKNYMKTMKAKFAQSKKPREAVLLAKAYYKEAKYKEAAHWALVANKLNSNLDESWFVFAKSKAKFGQRDEAIKILVSYYKKTHVPKAKELIEKIKKGSL